MAMRWDWKAVLGIVVSVLLLWWVLRDVHLAEVWDEVRRANAWFLAAAVVVTTGNFFLRALRWKVLLHPLREGTGLHNRFAATNIGFMANNLLPARLGELARSYAISRTEPVSMSGALGSLVVERFLDGVAVFVLMLVAVSWPTFPAEATVAGRPLGELLLLALGVVTALFVVLLVLLFFPSILLRMVGRVAGILPESVGSRLVHVVEAFFEGLASLRNPRLLAAGVAWSFAVWLWNGWSFWLGFRAFGIDLDMAAALFVQSLVAIGVSIPSAPGFFGTFHAAARVGLAEVYGVGAGAALAFAFGYHLGAFLPVTIIGLGYAWHLGMSLRQVEEEGADVTPGSAVGGPAGGNPAPSGERAPEEREP